MEEATTQSTSATSIRAKQALSPPVTRHVYIYIHVFPLVSTRRNRGSAGRGRVWPSVQSVEEQGVRVSQLQAVHRRLSLRATLGEVSGHGPQQQPHRQSQVSQSRRHFLFFFFFFSFPLLLCFSRASPRNCSCQHFFFLKEYRKKSVSS